MNNENTKKYLNIAIIIAMLGFVYSVWIYAGAYSRSIQPSSFRSFSASGEGKITAIPDVAQFTFSVITEGGKDIAKIQKENTGKVNNIIDFVKSKGVEAKDIKTQNYNLEPRYQYFSCPPQPLGGSPRPCPPAEIVGYMISQTVLVKIRDFGKIGEVLAGVVEKGANNVSQLSFAIDDLTVYQNQAREEAIRKAKEKAESIAEAGDFGVGKLLSIDEGGVTPIYGYDYLKAVPSVAGVESLPSPTIEPGSQEITVNVILRYEIK
ncbi:hypothetical protein A2999_00575 [Candidatus Wolfebacteria bacterium RIFCSPLOWO2_01_FULL_38_11]|uniref:26 kDa periplasmic immunogenic protein n=1 Tax=Candidatus Wolfebacteria bacterium RIFCSPLOWO2_01_FULL_38_11 TaxID=1802556 RepID=A0A1F8DQL7_9BACT|nr:MAG: hypothetical protein A2999_00575 [Candidatus Wolfebacteria bacterium RIFCSPLOWO2_01_FULL_38_11]